MQQPNVRNNVKINFNDVRFDKSFGVASQLPESTLPEVAFAGRSNVGKSSLINKLFGRRKLAMVSATPGKTATINFFVSGSVNFVDLPGYGFAQVSKTEKQRWARLIDEYFAQDRRFALVCTLVDIRHDAQKLDLDMVRYLQHYDLPFAVVFTKADKLSNGKAIQQASLLRKQLGLDESTPSVITSSETGRGIEDLQAIICSSCEGA